MDPELADAIKKYEQHLKDEEEQRKLEMEQLRSGGDAPTGDETGSEYQERVANPDLEPKIGGTEDE